ncbi:MAG: hypothetical protein NXH79_14075 [Rhodobacteraceae bacterium]|jgi:Flp pilus assembly pilin Flp|nr:hypothetical protein [Paracoccaceae bacterium]
MFHPFLTSESGAITVDWTVLTASLAGLGLAVGSVVSGGVQNLSNDIADFLSGVEMSDRFRDLIEQVCDNAGVGNGTAGMTYQGMPVTALLIYQAGDFIGGLPDEAQAKAEGGVPLTLQLSPDASPVVLLIADDDDEMHEVDNSQLVAADVTLDGTTYGAGFDVSSAYTLSDSSSGMMLSSLHFGDPWNGTQQGPVLATAASNPLEPGESYTFDGNQTTHNNEQPYGAYLGCGG